MSESERSKEELQRENAELRERLARLARAEEANASESREPRLRILLENSPDIITVMDLEANVLYVNRVVQGRKSDEILGTSAVAYMHLEERDRFMSAFRAVLATGEVQHLEVGTYSGYAWQTRLVPLRERGHTFAVMGIGTDITQRRRTEHALQESEEKLRLAVSATGIGLWRWDAESDELAWGGAMASLLGVSASELPRSLSEYEQRVHGEDRARVEEGFVRLRREGTCDDLEHRVLTPDGATHTLVWKGSGIRDNGGKLVGVQGGVFDLTQRKQLEEQLRHAQKMDALGQLTAGIAHNFNNMLTVILSNLQLGIPNASDPTRARLKDADHAARRAADMVRELMVFARRHPAPSKLPVDTREILLRTREICRTTFDKSIEIVVDIDGAAQPDGMLDGFSVLGDPGQLEQVLLNICLNARDALEMRPAGTPGASRIELLLRARPAADGGGRNGLCIEVRDNGPGMSEDVRRRIFEPFFTTKEIGRGTGLGLATAYGIVTDHGGTIECDSRPGEGSTFRVWLPSDATPDAARAAHEAAQPKRETVLLVEDDDMVRRTTCAVLESGGYDVLQAENGEDAIALYRREAARIRLVVLDWTMPRVSGERVLEELVRFSSDVRVVLFSGQYPGGKLPSNVRGIVQKPAPVESLLATVRNALDS